MRGNIGQLMKQAQAMQQNMQKMQDQLAQLEVEGQSGAGLVKIQMTCKYDVKRVLIDPSLVGDDKEMLEDLVAAAFNDAARRVEATIAEKMGSVTDRVVTPGLISTHAHIGGSPLDRSFIEDRGTPQFWYSGLFEMLPVRSEGQDEEGGRACVDFSMAELLRGGVTTVMEIGGLGEYVVERAAHYGF